MKSMYHISNGNSVRLGLLLSINFKMSILSFVRMKKQTEKRKEEKTLGLFYYVYVEPLSI